MNPTHFAYRINGSNDVLLTTDGTKLCVTVEGDDGRGLLAYLSPMNASRLADRINDWIEKWEDGDFDVETTV